jgi:hypothetical protein
MTSSLGRRLENTSFSSFAEVTETEVEISFHSTWISNLSTNKKIEIRRIVTELDPGDGYPFNLQIDYFTNQNSSYKIFNILIALNLRT